MTNELEVIVDGEVVIVPIENAENRRSLLRALMERFKIELIIKLDGKVICVSKND